MLDGTCENHHRERSVLRHCEKQRDEAISQSRRWCRYSYVLTKCEAIYIPTLKKHSSRLHARQAHTFLERKKYAKTFAAEPSLAKIYFVPLTKKNSLRSNSFFA